MGEEVAVKRLDGYGLQGLPNFLREVQVRLLATCTRETKLQQSGVAVSRTVVVAQLLGRRFNSAPNPGRHAADLID